MKGGKMERLIERLIEKYGGDEEKLKNELLNTIKRGGTLGLLAAKEAIIRFPTKEVLYEIIRLRKITKPNEKEKNELKIKATKIAKEKGLIDEKFLSAILEELSEKTLLREISREYLQKNPKNPNGLLKEILEKTKLSEASRRLLKQTNNPDYLSVIAENSKGKVQDQALEKLFKVGIPKKEFIWLTAYTDPTLAEKVWKKGRESRTFDELNVDDLHEIANYTEVPVIKKEATILMWLKREDIVEEEQLEFLLKNAHLVTIEKPKVVRKWIEERLISEEGIPLETILKIQRGTKNLETKLKATEIGIERIKTEIAQLTSRLISEGLTIWERERLKFLEGKLEKLEFEYSMLRESICSSPY
jgi:hypothetical protein